MVIRTQAGHATPRRGRRTTSELHQDGRHEAFVASCGAPGDAAPQGRSHFVGDLIQVVVHGLLKLGALVRSGDPCVDFDVVAAGLAHELACCRRADALGQALAQPAECLVDLNGVAAYAAAVDWDRTRQQVRGRAHPSPPRPAVLCVLAIGLARQRRRLGKALPSPGSLMRVSRSDGRLVPKLI